MDSSIQGEVCYAHHFWRCNGKRRSAKTPICTAMCAAQAIAIQVAAHSFLSFCPGLALASEVCPDNDLPSDTRSEFERYAIAAVC